MVTFEQYQQVVADRPKKFTAEEVGFEPASSGAERCQGCWHWYQGPKAGRQICEIFVGQGEERQVNPEAVCKFWTADGAAFALLEQEKPEEKPKKDPVPPAKRHTIG